MESGSWTRPCRRCSSTATTTSSRRIRFDLWTSPAFEPVIRKTELHPEGAIFARGACDDKGQMFMHVKALEAMVQSGDQPVNLKFIIEGEEEVGSDHLEDFLIQNKELLAADVVLISDTGIIANDMPSITTGLRGLCYVEVKMTGPNRDLHSGLYGGAAPNPINILCEMVLPEGRPAAHHGAGFLRQGHRAVCRGARSHGGSALQRGGLQGQHRHRGHRRVRRTTALPSGCPSVRPWTSMASGEATWARAPRRSSPPRRAPRFRCASCRTRIPDEITQLFVNHFESLCPESCQVDVTIMHGAHPAVTPIDHPGYRAACCGHGGHVRSQACPIPRWGSIPIVTSFETVLGLKTVLMGFGLDSDAIHSPDEHYGVFNYFKGIETIPHFHARFAEFHAG